MVLGRMYAIPRSGTNKIDIEKGTIFIDSKMADDKVIQLVRVIMCC